MLVSPVIVIGTPRSGTSIVAKWLMNDYGVRMCLEKFTDVNERVHGQKETYEDDYVVKCNSHLHTGRIKFKEYKRKMRWYFKKMSKTRGLWGFKDPRLKAGLPWILQYFDNDVTIIRTKRRASLVIKSMVEKLHFTELQAVRIINEYDLYFNKSLQGMTVIDVYFDGSRKLSDEFIQSFDKSLIDKQRMMA